MGCLTALLYLLGLASAQSPRQSSDVVKITAIASPVAENGGQKVTIALEIAKGYLVYANPVLHEALEPAQTVLKFKNASAKIFYPPGHVVKDAGVGDFHIYEGKVTIEALVDRNLEIATEPLECTLRLQANHCLLPSLVSLTLK